MFWRLALSMMWRMHKKQLLLVCRWELSLLLRKTLRVLLLQMAQRAAEPELVVVMTVVPEQLPLMVEPYMLTAVFNMEPESVVVLMRVAM